MSSAEDDRSSFPPRVSSAIAIPDAEFDDLDESDELLPSTPAQAEQWYVASPGAGSYVSGQESWRPVPPPMLASSLDRRFRPSLKSRPRQSESPAPALPRPPALTRPQSKPVEGASGSSSYGSIELQLGSEGDAVEPVPAAVLQMNRRQRTARAVPPRPKEEDVLPERRTTIRGKLTRLLVQVRQIKEAPRELWLIFALKFLSSYAYFSFSLILTIFLTNEFGLSDTAAGWSYGAYGVMSTFFGFLCGWVIDYLGVRTSLLVGSLVGATARFVLAVTPSRHTGMLMVYTFMPFAECLGIPIMTIGIKRYTNARNRTFAFSLFYSVMNVAALCAGPLVDFFRNMFNNGLTVHVAPLDIDIQLSAMRLVILSSSIATAAMCFVILIGVREINVDESGNLTTFTPNRQSPIEQTMAVLREPAFWRLTVFTVLLVGVRLVFRHLDATMPKYLVRQFGPSAPFGLIYSINPFLIIFLVPVVGLVTRKVDSFTMIVSGSFVSAMSPFWLCLKQSYLTVVLLMVTLSLGEAVYSPRVYEYTMEVSAHGAEGLYSSLSTAPLFSVQLLVGGMSGWLLSALMPVHGPHHGNVLWGIIGITSMTSPILMWLFRGFISPPADDEATKALTVSNFNVPAGKQVSEVMSVGSARPPMAPPKRQSSAIIIQSNDGNENGCQGEDDENDIGQPPNYLGKSPLSLPPLSSGQLANLISQFQKPSDSKTDTCSF